MPDFKAMTELVLAQPVRGKEVFLELCCGWEVENKYEAKTTDGNLMFEINEESNCCIRQCMGKRRCMELIAKDEKGQNLFSVKRPYRMNCCCISAKNCLGRDYMEVKDANGTIIGSVGANFMCCGICYSLSAMHAMSLFHATRVYAGFGMEMIRNFAG